MAFVQVSRRGTLAILFGGILLLLAALSCTTSDTSPASPTNLPPAPTPVKASLAQALAQDWVKASIFGNDLSRIKVEIEPKLGYEFTLTIEAGTVFDSRSAGVQDMVVRQTCSTVIHPEFKQTLEIEAACAEMHKEMPGEGDRYDLSASPAGPTLQKLLSVEAFHAQTFRVQQFAIWTLTDNPARDEYLGVSTLGTASGPLEAELETIRGLFLQAGLQPGKYRALGGTEEGPEVSPLLGTWKGISRNGDFQMEITVTIEAACQEGQVCGSFEIPSLPCNGGFRLVNVNAGKYEFEAVDKQGACGTGRDFLEPLPDGTLRYISLGEYGENTGILERIDP